MASQFNNRLVGVTILVASVVIFLPSIIDGKKTAYQDEFVSTPIKPVLKAHTTVTQQAPPEPNLSSNTDQAASDETPIENGQWEIEEVAETVTISSAKEIQVEEKVEAKAPDKPLKVAKIIVPERAWTIQLGAFQNAQNINILLKKLHKAGLSTTFTGIRRC